MLPARRRLSPGWAGGRRPCADRGRVEGVWRQRGFEPGESTDPPGQVWEDFVHATDELVMVLEGALEIEIDGEATRPPVGEEVLIPAGARHTVRNVGGTPARWLHGHRRG